MKTKHAIIVTGLIILFLSGCIPSIHPLYTEDDIVFKSELLGTWYEKADTRWVFEKHGENQYLMTYVEDHEVLSDSASVSDFVVTLLKLDDTYYLDLYPGENDQINFSSLLISTLLPTHIFAKVEFIEEFFTIRFFNRDWLENLLEQNRIRIAHEKTPDYTVLTASTEELQKFVKKYADVKEAYNTPIGLMRSLPKK
nr:hypothetical protein [Bacteroidota bacterium]